MARKVCYDENGNTYEADEDAFDENGILKDGKSVRIPVFLRDGETVGGITLEDAVKLLDECSPEDRRKLLGDIGRQVGRQSGYQLKDSGKVSDRITRLNARDAYVNDLSDAWRGGQVDGQPGDSCTTASGQPGKLCTTDGKLKCVPLSRTKSSKENHEWEIAGPLSDAKDAEGMAARDAARALYIDGLTNAWKSK